MSFKKILSILLVMTFLTAAMPVGAAAEGNVVSIEIADFEVIEGTHGWHVVSTVDGAVDSTEWFEYDIEPDEVTVNCTDGSSETLSPDELRERGYSVDFFCEGGGQNPDNPWGIGAHEVTCEIEGVRTAYTITVTETPVASITAVGRSYMEGTNCFKYTEYDNDGEIVDEFVWYDDRPSAVIITYKDGTGLICENADELKELTGYEGYCSSGQIERHWEGPGKYTVVFEYLGVSCTYEIELTESPYDHISVDDMAFTEGTNQYPDTVDGVKFKRYDCSPDRVNVFMKDGTKTVMDYQMLLAEFGEIGILEDDQSPDNVWGPGVHTAHYRVGGMECDFEVEIIPGPVESISAVDFVCTEGIDGYIEFWDTSPMQSWFKYSYANTVVTVTMRDGTEITTRDCEFEYEGEYYRIECEDDQSYENQWQVGGKYTGTLSVCGKSCDIAVWVDESPIDRVEFDPMILMENVDGYYYENRDYETGEVLDTFFLYEYYPDYTVFFKDGTSVRSEGGWVEMFGERYCVSYGDDQRVNAWGVGDHEVEMYLGGYITTATVTVVPDPVSSVTISGIDDLYITLNYNDDTRETFRASGFENNSLADEGTLIGTVNTEEGRNIPATVKYAISDDGVNEMDRNVSVSVGVHESNTLPECLWFKNHVMFDSVLYYTAAANRMLGFEGYRTDEEYDPAALAYIAVMSCLPSGSMTDYSEDGALCLAQYETETVKAAVRYLFGIENFDASAIEYNDPSDPDHVWIRVPGAWLDFPGGRDREKTQDGWNFFFHPDGPLDLDYDVLTVGTDEDLVIKNITFGNEAKLESIEISGDLTLEFAATFSDGSTAHATATGIDVDDPAAYPLTGTLHTDSGDVECEICFDIEPDGTHRYVGRNVYLVIDGVRSNTLSSNTWLKSRLLGNSLPFVASIFKLARPEWEGIDASNADANDLVEFAAYCTGEFSNYEVNFANGKPYIKVPTSIARKIVYYVYGIDNLDLSGYRQIGTQGTSEYLDVELFDFDFADIPGGTTEIEFTDNPDFDMVGMEHTGDRWTVTFTVTDGDPGYDGIVVTTDWKFNVLTIEFTGEEDAVIGDANGDGSVNMKDILLLRRILAGAAEPTPEEAARADVNGDGSFNMKDILLLRRIVAGVE